MLFPRVVLGSLLLCGAAVAQQYVISTVAGGAPPPTPVPALSASIGIPVGLATDVAGNLYFSTSLYCVFKMDRSGVLTLIAGTSRLGYSGDGGPAIAAQLYGAGSLAVDAAGNIYIVDYLRLRRVSPSGTITTVAGNGTRGFSGDGGPAINAQLNDPVGVAVDSAGNVYIADRDNYRVRRVSPSGIITTVAGNGTPGFSGDNGPAMSAQLNDPVDVAVDSTGNVYIVDELNYRVRKVSPSDSSSTLCEERGL